MPPRFFLNISMFILISFMALLPTFSMENEESFKSYRSIPQTGEALRKKINNALSTLSTESSPLLKNKPPVETSLVTYSPTPALLKAEENSPEAWDNKPLFMQDFDDKFFNQPTSSSTKFLLALMSLYGFVQPTGLAPLVMYLGENLLFFLPVGGTVAMTLSSSMIGLTGIASANQMYERAKKIMNSLVDYNGLTPSKDDKKPHIQKLKYEWDSRCCSSLSMSQMGTLFACVNGAFRTLPVAMLFWEAERFFPEFRYIVIGPLLTLFFDKSYTESKKFFLRRFHAAFAAENHMVEEKKRILRDRIKDLQHYLTEPQSDKLVKVLYATITKTLKEKRQEEQIFALSSLILKRTKIEAYRDLPKQVENLASNNIENNELLDISIQVKASSIQETQNLVSDIDNVYKKTTARTFLEKFAGLLTGASTIGRFLISQWAIETFLGYFGINPTTTFWTSSGFALSDLVLRAASEWYIQEETILELRHCGSTRMDYWPFRWGTKLISAAGSLFYTLPAVAIIFRVFDDSVPLYIRVLVAATVAPTEFSSFYTFFSQKYGNIIRGFATWSDKNISEKNVRAQRAWLLDKTDRLLKIIEELDQESTQLLYHLTQGGL